MRLKYIYTIITVLTYANVDPKFDMVMSYTVI